MDRKSQSATKPTSSKFKKRVDAAEDEDTPQKRRVVPDAEEESAIPATGSLTSFFDVAFDSVSGGGDAIDIPHGNYEAIITEVVKQKFDAKGQSIRMKFELCDPDFGENNKLTTWFKICDKDHEAVTGGILALKATLAKLGYKPSGAELPEVFDQIMEDRPGVILKVSSAVVDGVEWPRITVMTVCDNDIVMAYKDQVEMA
jgi:hypothetical protein